PLGGDLAEVGDLRRIVPGVVEDGPLGVGRRSTLLARAQESVDGLLLIAAWVPSAISTVTEEARPASASWIAGSTLGSGTERVPSGMIRQTDLPSRSWPASCSATKPRICSSLSTPSVPPSRDARSASPSGIGWIVGGCVSVVVWLMGP